MSYTEGPTRTFSVSSLSAAKGLRLVLSAGVLVAAGATSLALGVAEFKILSTDESAVLRMRTSGSIPMIANGAITAGANVYAAASGKVGSTGAIIEGVALTAASADGDLIEVLPVGALSSATTSVAATGSAQGDAAALSIGLNTVSAADGTKGVVLPTAYAGARVQVYNEHASNGLKIYPATGADVNDGTANAAITIEGKTLATFVALDTTTWAAQYTVNT